MHNDTHLRSIVKALSWKILATLLAFILAYVSTDGDTVAAGKTAIGLFTIGLALYYLHERIWNVVPWGRQ
jgi:uncharacterized membrane protein